MQGNSAGKQLSFWLRPTNLILIVAVLSLARLATGMNIDLVEDEATTVCGVSILRWDTTITRRWLPIGFGLGKPCLATLRWVCVLSSFYLLQSVRSFSGARRRSFLTCASRVGLSFSSTPAC